MLGVLISCLIIKNVARWLNWSSRKNPPKQPWIFLGDSGGFPGLHVHPSERSSPESQRHSRSWRFSLPFRRADDPMVSSLLSTPLVSLFMKIRLQKILPKDLTQLGSIYSLLRFNGVRPIWYSDIPVPRWDPPTRMIAHAMNIWNLLFLNPWSKQVGWNPWESHSWRNTPCIHPISHRWFRFCFFYMSSFSSAHINFDFDILI